MNDKLDNLLCSLETEIDRKCIELKDKKQERRQAKKFYFICVMVLIIPSLIVFLGFNILSWLIPVILFFALFVLILSPVIFINDTGGTVNETI
jgi:uncharacterized membrane protein YdbT with pleckstrin-like domain